MSRNEKPNRRRIGRTNSRRRNIQHDLRIVGGALRRRSLICTDDPSVRPMKQRIREAVFNLIGDEVAGRPVLDLFAGSGAMAIESLSRGAKRATLVERHFPTVQVINQNLSRTDVEDKAQVANADAFYWVQHELQRMSESWTVFCCPHMTSMWNVVAKC